MVDDPVTRILRRDPRYARAAYEFVGDALRVATQEGDPGHVRAPQLLDAIRRLARTQFGPLARTVLADWGIHTTDDFGQIVFNLIDVKAFRKTDEDHISDFADLYAFDEAFPDETGPVRIHDEEDELDLEDLDDIDEEDEDVHDEDLDEDE